MDAYGSALVNFMYQLDWAMRYPDIWSNIILSVAVWVFSDAINTGINRLGKDLFPFSKQWADGVPSYSRRVCLFVLFKCSDV